MTEYIKKIRFSSKTFRQINGEDFTEQKMHILHIYGSAYVSVLTL